MSPICTSRGSILGLAAPFLLPICLAAGLGWPPSAAAHPGQWSDSLSWNLPLFNRYAIHMALVPGDGALYHSRILWFRGEAPNRFDGGEWGWLTGSASCSAYPATSFIALPIAAPGMDVFCAGQTSLGDGRVFIPGGTDPVTGHFGENKTRIYTRGTGMAAGSWTPTPPDMVDWRWYPTATTLPDGRVLTTGGNRHPNHRGFGGRRNGASPSAPTGDLVQRFAPVNLGLWESSVTPTADATSTPSRPDPRESHTFVEMSGFPSWEAGQVLFGGRDGAGVLKADTWFLLRENPLTSADYTYRWWRQAKTGPVPLERSDHVSAGVMDSLLVIHGGSRTGGLGRGDSWILRRRGQNFEWDAVIQSGSIPSDRLGHGAIHNKMSVRQADGSLQNTSRLIIFGGVASTSSTPNDSLVYELRLNPSAPKFGAWRSMKVVDLGFGKPAPRSGHALVALDRGDTRTHSSGKQAKTNVLFGGKTGASTFSNEVWILWAFEDSTVGWEKKTFGGTAPTERARAALVADIDQGQSGGRLYVSGGEGSSGIADRYVHVVDLWKSGAQWAPWAALDVNLTGHTMTNEWYWTHARKSEVYEPATNTRITYSSAPFGWNYTYPLLFTVPGGSSPYGRILTVGHQPETYWLDLPPPGQQPAAGWQTLNKSTGFLAETAVQYKPGRILVAGGTLGNVPVGTSKTLNTTNLAGGWTPSGDMESRIYHNLVLLPNGKVLVLGGNGAFNQRNTNPVRKPQIWDPELNGGAGAWSHPDSLAIQPTIRGYHSTTLLLPDARVLSAGGENHDDKYVANLYCPPYLFKGDTLAARPVVTNAPSSAMIGRHFSVSVADTTGIRTVALLRPGATTHTFDANQRYVPLTFKKSGNPACLEVSAPASLDEAPVGYYMLFVVGSKDGPEVPSVATWLRIDAPGPDAISPGSVSSLTIENIARWSAAVGWYAPGDDGMVGTATSFKLHYSTSPINACNFDLATPVAGMPTPGSPGTYHCIEIDDLLQCRTYYFALMTLDEAGNASLVSNVVSGATTCAGNTYALCSGSGLLAQGGGGNDWFTENSLFHETAGATDVLGLREPPPLASGRQQVRFVKSGVGFADVDRVSLGYVDHETGTRAVEGLDRIWVGTQGEVASAIDGLGVDRRSELTGDAPTGLPFETDGVLTVTLPGATSASAIVVEASRPAAGIELESSGILIEKPDGGSSWRTIARIHPRRIRSPIAVPVEGSSTVRLRSFGSYRLRALGRFDSAQGLSAQALTLESALHNRSGDVTTALASTGGASARLLTGESVLLRFEPASSAAPAARSYFLETKGAYTALGPSGAEGGIQVAKAANYPLAFHGGAPNPFTRGTTIAYSVPAAAHVRVRIFDVRGRVVATLVDGVVEAGEHAFTWDGSGTDGEWLPTGVYFARMERGGWLSEKKLILVGR